MYVDWAMCNALGREMCLSVRLLEGVIEEGEKNTLLLLFQVQKVRDSKLQGGERKKKKVFVSFGSFLKSFFLFFNSRFFFFSFFNVYL